MPEVRINRQDVAKFLNTTPAAAATYSRIGKTPSSTKNYNPATTSEIYIDQESATTTLDNYAPTQSFDMKANEGEAVFDFLDDLRIAEATLTDAETDVIEVRLYETPTILAYPATQKTVSVQIDSGPGGDGGAQAVISFTLNDIGDPVQGSFDTGTLIFTPTP